MARQSAMFNTRAVAALRHPDLSDRSLESFEQQKAQIPKRKAKKRSYRSRKIAETPGSRSILCLLASLLLAALVATYVSIATTETDLSTTFHVMFIFGICLATIVFAHSVIRLFIVGRRSPNRPLFVAVSAPGHQRRHHGHHRHHCQRHPRLRRVPNFPDDQDAFVPPTPIQVHLSSDDIREDRSVPVNTTASGRPGSGEWDKDVRTVPNPPPAYGRWRDSVRANPDLLHLQPVVSPISPDTPTLPSPTYDEAMAAAQNETPGNPPSYMTRESPARQRDMREARAGLAQPQAVEPEMMEVRGAHVGLAM
ncbi:Hypothetical predicted protein [Lecanosticta acicola]|uniref:Uncharacterized protein n=1 Tax=Lecanosticta acicola TaxID=111012 RepID=A0AAI9EEC8_9PEZI|nr:Hypothetical predicted protein [Lecanosticta acicola]